jgi:hypothetical protein
VSRALVLAAHGAGDGSAANRAVRAPTRGIEEMEVFDLVTPAFRLGGPSISDVLEGLSPAPAVVVPLLAGDCRYAVVFPRGLAGNRRFPPGGLRVTRPVGEHSTVHGMVRDAALEMAWRAGFSPAETAACLILGHGSRRRPSSGRESARVAVAVRERVDFAEVRAAYNDFEALARIDSIVVLMGLSTLRTIARALIAAGKDRFTPAACNSRGTTPGERVVTATFNKTADRAGAAELESPATTVIGDGVGLRSCLLGLPQTGRTTGRRRVAARTVRPVRGPRARSGNKDRGRPGNIVTAARRFRSLVSSTDRKGDPKCGARASATRAEPKAWQISAEAQKGKP